MLQTFDYLPEDEVLWINFNGVKIALNLTNGSSPRCSVHCGKCVNDVNCSSSWTKSMHETKDKFLLSKFHSKYPERFL